MIKHPGLLATTLISIVFIAIFNVCGMYVARERFERLGLHTIYKPKVSK